MPIKKLSSITEKSNSYQKTFLRNCHIYEKISSFYFHVKIKSVSSLVFYKSNNKEIEMEDLILNKMWNTPIQDFTSMFLSDKEFMEKCVGFTFSFFFFPTPNPLGVNYADNEDGTISFRYILDHITTPNKKSIPVGYINEFARMDKFNLIRKSGICVKSDLRTTEENRLINQSVKSRDFVQIESVVRSLIDENKLCAHSQYDTEGFVLRYENEVYQLLNEPKEISEIKNNRLALEIFIHNFAEFLRQTEFTDCFVSNNYITNVCHLLLKYNKWLQNSQNQQMFSFYNIKPEDLESPTFGYYGGTFYNLIPVMKVRELCVTDKFWDNAFKILLNGLKKKKRFNPNDLILTENDINSWNELVNVISVYNKMNKGLNLKNLIR